MHRLGRTEQHRADRDASASRRLQQVVADVRGVDVGQHEQVGLTGQCAAGHQFGPVVGIQRGIAVHFAVNLQPWRLRLQQGQCVAHLDGRRLVARAEIAVRQQGRLRSQPETQHLFGRHDRDLGELRRGRIVIDVGVDQHHLAARQDQTVHARIRFGAWPEADHLIDVVQVQLRASPRAAQHAVDLARFEQHRADQGQPAAHLDLCKLRGDTLAGSHLMIFLPVIAVTVVIFGIDQIVITAGLKSQTELGDALDDHFGPPDQRRASQPFVDHHLRGTQHAFFLAFGKRDAFVLGLLGHVENRAHRRARGINEGLQFFPVGIHVGDRALRHPRFGRCKRHRRGNAHHQPRVERLRNQIFRTKAQIHARVGGGDHFALFGLGQFGDGVHRGDFHLDRDRGRA